MVALLPGSSTHHPELQKANKYTTVKTQINEGNNRKFQVGYEDDA